MTMTSSAITPE